MGGMRKKERSMHHVSYLWRNLGSPLLWLWPLITIDKELRDAVVKFATWK
jgi:hypothetical protein